MSVQFNERYEDTTLNIDMIHASEHVSMDGNVVETYLLKTSNSVTEKDAIKNYIIWPHGEEVLSERNNVYLATMACPTLFPTASADFTYPIRLRIVEWISAIRHLLKCARKDETGRIVYPFAEHTTFAIWAYNLYY